MPRGGECLAIAAGFNAATVGHEKGKGVREPSACVRACANVKLLLDENISPWVAETLRKDGLDVWGRLAEWRVAIFSYLIYDFPSRANHQDQHRDR